MDVTSLKMLNCKPIFLLKTSIRNNEQVCGRETSNNASIIVLCFPNADRGAGGPMIKPTIWNFELSLWSQSLVLRAVDSAILTVRNSTCRKEISMILLLHRYTITTLGCKVRAVPIAYRHVIDTPFHDNWWQSVFIYKCKELSNIMHESIFTSFIIRGWSAWWVRAWTGLDKLSRSACAIISAMCCAFADPCISIRERG